MDVTPFMKLFSQQQQELMKTGGTNARYHHGLLIEYGRICHHHGLLIEYGRICHIVKLPISMIRPFSLVNNSHITLYPQLEIIWKVSKSLRKYWGKYGHISFYIISCITRDCIIVENIFLV